MAFPSSAGVLIVTEDLVCTWGFTLLTSFKLCSRPGMTSFLLQSRKQAQRDDMLVLSQRCGQGVPATGPQPLPSSVLQTRHACPPPRGQLPPSSHRATSCMGLGRLWLWPIKHCFWLTSNVAKLITMGIQKEAVGLV